ncbi:hypothetical protein D9M71_293330 [compost metagenome]
MQLLQRALGVVDDGAFSDFQLKKRRIQAGITQHIGDLVIKVRTPKRTARDIHRDKFKITPLGLPLNHLRAGLAHHPAVDFADQPGTLGNGNEVGRRYQPALRMLPAHQRLDADHPPAAQVMHRLVIHTQFLSFKGPAQLAGGLHALQGPCGQLLGVQGIAGAPTVLGLEQCRVGIAQQLLGTQGIARAQADPDAGTDEQGMAVQHEGIFEHIDEGLCQCGNLIDLVAMLDQHGKLVTAQAGQGGIACQPTLEAFGNSLE